MVVKFVNTSYINGSLGWVAMNVQKLYYGSWKLHYGAPEAVLWSPELVLWAPKANID